MNAWNQILIMTSLKSNILSPIHNNKCVFKIHFLLNVSLINIVYLINKK